MTQIDISRKQVQEYKDTLVLCGFEIFKLVGFAEDDDDNYWVFETLKDGFARYSVLIGWTPLYGVLPKKAYKELVELWDINHEKKFEYSV